MPTMATTVWDMALAMLDMVDIPTEAMDADILARGLLMLSPLLMLMPTMDTTVLAMPDMLDIPTDLPMDTDTLARGLLMLSLLRILRSWIWSWLCRICWIPYRSAYGGYRYIGK